MAQRKHYWSCSRFADWLRGTGKPTAETSTGWNQWRKRSKAAHPIRFWLAEEGLDHIQNFIWWPLDQVYNLKYYINNRWVTGTHRLTAHPRDIRPGQWHDVGNRFLPCLFNELVNYVEVELAWWHIAWDREAREKFRAPFWASGWFRWRTWRCPEAGLENLAWQSSLRWRSEEVGEDDARVGELTPQAQNAQEILALYRWWTEVYPQRPDPHDASGWTQYHSGISRDTEDADGLSWLDRKRSPEEQARVNDMLDLCHKIEQQYTTEDTEMLIRLIRVRDSLWT